MNIGSRFARFLFAIFADLREQDIIRGEQRLLSFLAEKNAGGRATGRDPWSWIPTALETNRLRLAALEAKPVNKSARACRALMNSLPWFARNHLQRMARQAFSLGRSKAPSLGNTPHAASDCTIAVPFDTNLATDESRQAVGVIAHIFYPDIAAEMRAYLENIPGLVDLYISTDSVEKRALIDQAFAGWPNGRVEVRVAPNRGRDVAPKLITFRDVYNRHSLVLHLHTKKSPHDSSLRYWRPFIFETLIGDRAVASSIISIFDRHPEIGMIAPEHYFGVKHFINWAGNLDSAQALAGRMGARIDPDAPLDFPSGSMFWARSAALKPLLDLNLSFEDFDPEEGQINGTLAHAVERLYFHVCEVAGYRWVNVCRRGLANE